MWKIAILALGLAGACLAQTNRLTPAEEAAGWQLLFDGRSLNGWEDPARKSPPGNSFTVEDGAIRVLAKPRIQEELFTTAVFGDFELLFDWRISPRGNSGLKYRIQDNVFVVRDPKIPRFEDLVEASLKNRPPRGERGQDYVIGFEYQVIDRANSDAQRGARQQAGALYDLVGPPSDPARPAGEWNQARVVLRGNHVEHWLNGVKVVDVDRKSVV